MPRYTPEFCPYCGSELVAEARPGGYCSECDELVYKQPVTAVETLVVDCDAVLLQKRAAGRRPGTWGFPGGHVEPGEPPWVAAARELDEETGLRVDASALAPLDTVFDANPDGSEYVVHGYLVPRGATEGALRADPAETDALAFCPPGERPDGRDLFHPRYRERIEHAIAVVEGDALPARRRSARIDLRE